MLIHSISHLSKLQNLSIEAQNTIVHVDDVLKVLRANPQVISLHFSSTKLEFSPSKAIMPYTGFVPISDTAPSMLIDLGLHDVKISDEAMLRLLGIPIKMDSDIAMDTAEQAHTLAQLTLASDGPTYRSGIRIFQQCQQLDRVDLQHTNMATLELLQGEFEWPGSESIKALSLDIKHSLMGQQHHHDLDQARKDNIPICTTEEQEQIYERLSTMTSLRHIVISGYPIDTAAIRDISFVTGLQLGHVSITHGRFASMDYNIWKHKIDHWAYNHRETKWHFVLPGHGRAVTFRFGAGKD
ncbi:hypothetical protein BG006_010843, partial [Podila minutissima]